MSEKKQNFPVALVWWELIVAGIVSWIVRKVLDFVWAKGKAQFRENNLSSNPTLMQTVGKRLIKFSFKIIVGREPSINQSINPFILRQIEAPFALHDSLHKVGLLGEKCLYCKNLLEDKEYWKKFTPNIDRFVPYRKDSEITK